MTYKILKTENYLLIVSGEEIKEGDCYFSPSGIWFYNIINPNLIFNPNITKEIKKVICHLPINNSPILKGVPLLPLIDENVYELSEKDFIHMGYERGKIDFQVGFTRGYDKSLKVREKYRYTEEDMAKAMLFAFDTYAESLSRNEMKLRTDDYIKSINQYPTEFVCEMDEYCRPMPNIHSVYYKPKTITTSQGIQWVGKYQ